MKKLLLGLLVLGSLSAIAGEAENKRLAEIVQAQDGKLVTVESIKMGSEAKIEFLGDLNCTNLGDLNCAFGTCSVKAQYSDQGGPGEAIISIAVSLTSETCEESPRFTATELVSWD